MRKLLKSVLLCYSGSFIIRNDFITNAYAGGVRSHNLKLSKKFIYVFNFLTHIKRKSTHINANCIYMSTLPNL